MIADFEGKQNLPPHFAGERKKNGNKGENGKKKRDKRRKRKGDKMGEKGVKGKNGEKGEKGEIFRVSSVFLFRIGSVSFTQRLPRFPFPEEVLQ